MADETLVPGSTKISLTQILATLEVDVVNANLDPIRINDTLVDPTTTGDNRNILVYDLTSNTLKYLNLFELMVLLLAPDTGDDGKVLTFDNGTGTFILSAAGTGDVVGPASAFDTRIAVFDGTTGKLIKDGGSTIASIANATHTGEVTGSAALTLDPTSITNKSASTPVAGDFLLYSDTVAGGALKKVDLANLPTPAASDWSVIDSSKFTALPASTSTLTMSDTSDFKVKDPVRYVTSAGTFFAEIASITPSTSIDIRGAPFVTGGAENLTELAVGGHWLRKVIRPPVIGDAGIKWSEFISSTLLEDFPRIALNWDEDTAFCIGFSGSQAVPDAVSQAKMNVLLDGSRVSTNNSNLGIQLGASHVRVVNPDVAINKTNYSILNGQRIEIECTDKGGSFDAESLTTTLIFILEGK